MELKNNTILITGGTSGFGFEFASKLMALGNTVIITGRNARKLEETQKILPGVHTFQSDVSKAEEISDLYDQVIEQFPNLNLLINNAGEMRKIILHDEYNLEDITREIEINLMGPVRMVQQFLPHLKRKPNAAIVNVTSGIALGTYPIAPIYSASKSGLRSYTQSLRVQLQHTNIKVFEVIAPGALTPLNDKFMNDEGFNPKMLASPEKIVEESLTGLQKDHYEIYPGIAKMIRVVARLAPGFAIAQTAKSFHKILAAHNASKK
jgi:uncharacterized oxidoreductase